jgi:hypothetical protein
MGPPVKVAEKTADAQNGRVGRSKERRRDVDRNDLWVKGM